MATVGIDAELREDIVRARVRLDLAVRNLNYVAVMAAAKRCDVLLDRVLEASPPSAPATPSAA